VPGARDHAEHEERRQGEADDASPTLAGMRLRLDLAYDGTDFHGWAMQPNGLRTVEGELSAAVATVLRLDEPARLTVAGRTDAGVHAMGQVVHVDLEPEDLAAARGRSDRTPLQALLTRLRGVLPPDVLLHRLAEAPDGFDARFSALSRRYRYLISDDPERLDPLRRREVVTLRTPLDVEAMDAAAEQLLGLRNFAAFCKKREGASTTRTLLRYDWRRRDDGLLEATVLADAFCHSMVRALIGALVPVGEGRQGADFPREVLTARSRDPRVKVMPAHGLCLVEVTYPQAEALAARAVEARARREE
jgi:tRNA pseudouridine38-40 synthase